MRSLPTHPRWLVIALLCIFSVNVFSATLPENRADVMFHYYNGDGVEVSGPALLVREDMLETFSVNASYYMDSISGASVDVRTVASRYTDTRQQYGLGLDYLYQDVLLGMAFSTSSENDYDADTVDINVSHEAFGGMTTISLGYARGWDTVGKINDDFKDRVDRNTYRLGVAQVLSPTWLVNFAYEGVTDDGYLNSPYRPIRLFGGFGSSERYPRTRGSHALAFNGIKMLLRGTRRSSVRFGYRYYSDTWEIAAHTVSMAYVQKLSSQLTLDFQYRFYNQSKAAFFNNSFNQEFNYMARDKELSAFSDHSLGAKFSFEFSKSWRYFDRVSLNFSYKFIRFDYSDFRDYSQNQAGEAFGFDAEVFQFFLSAWY